MRLIGLPSGVQLLTGLAIGAAAVLLAPVVLPALAGALRSLAKAGVKGGMIAYAKTQVALAEAKESLEDLTAEAQAELAEEQEQVVAPKKKVRARSRAKASAVENS
ncbi:MAG: DUF5132 domain-containing protein [Deltaproteobacteria bacterium]|nr:DUF5132 domain-containing protein [Deltaproteobacteria bacterium]